VGISKLYSFKGRTMSLLEGKSTVILGVQAQWYPTPPSLLWKMGA